MSNDSPIGGSSSAFYLHNDFSGPPPASMNRNQQSNAAPAQQPSATVGRDDQVGECGNAAAAAVHSKSNKVRRKRHKNKSKSPRQILGLSVDGEEQEEDVEDNVMVVNNNEKSDRRMPIASNLFSSDAAIVGLKPSNSELNHGAASDWAANSPYCSYVNGDSASSFTPQVDINYAMYPPTISANVHPMMRQYQAFGTPMPPGRMPMHVMGKSGGGGLWPVHPNLWQTDYASLPPVLNVDGLTTAMTTTSTTSMASAEQRRSITAVDSSDSAGKENNHSNNSRFGVGVNQSMLLSEHERVGGGGSGPKVDANLRNGTTSSEGSSSTTSSSSTTWNSKEQQQTSRSLPNSAGGGGGGGISGSEPNGQLLGTLLQQINLLHETNSKICRNLHETKVELEALKHAPSWGLPRHRRDSISGMSTHSQPVGYAFGAQSPAPTFHSGTYTPGMLTDVVREVREGARIREEALLSRVKSLVDERTWQATELSMRLQREVDDLRGQVQQLLGDKQKSSQRVNDLEMEVKTMKIVFNAQLQLSGGGSAGGGVGVDNRLYQQGSRTTIVDKQVAAAGMGIEGGQRRRNSLNIKYGVMHESVNDEENVEAASEVAVDYDEDAVIIKDQLGVKYGRQQQQSKMMAKEVEASGATTQDHEALLQLEKETLDLRRELQDAVAGKKQAENRILALERKIVTMKQQQPQPVAEMKLNNLSNNSGKGMATTNGGGVATNTDSMNLHSKTSTPKGGGGAGVAAGSTAATNTNHSNGFCLTGPVTDL